MAALTVTGLAVMIGCNAVLGNEEGTPRPVSSSAPAGTAPTVTRATIGDGGSLNQCDTSQGNKICFGVCVKTNDTSTGCGDPASCVACEPKNADTSQCKGGPSGFTCGYDACKTGYLDCDSNQANGCETPMGAAHCGDCGISCLGTANPICGPDAAHPGKFICVNSCTAPTVNCNGACVDTSSSTENCGGCGIACSKPGYTASCVNEACQYTCANGTHDCNGTCVNGVDTNACGPKCLVCPSDPTNHVLATCSTDGTCGTTCAPGYIDCDGLTSNGCEVQGTLCPINTSSTSGTSGTSGISSGSTSGTAGCLPCGGTSGPLPASIEPLNASGGTICACPAF
jgi:hypothetical protein